MTSSGEDFTSDDLLNAGFSSTATTSPSQAGPPPLLGEQDQAEDDQNQPIEIPRGSDDNSEWAGSLEGSVRVKLYCFQVPRTENSSLGV